jgi:hypothetical protein
MLDVLKENEPKKTSSIQTEQLEEPPFSNEVQKPRKSSWNIFSKLFRKKKKKEE